MTKQSFDILAPLQNFRWRGECFELSPGLFIKSFAQLPDLKGWDTKFSSDEQYCMSTATHWLTFRWEKETEPSPAANVNLVLIAFWLVKPSRTSVAFRFRLGAHPTTDAGGTRLLDRFRWISGTAGDEFIESDLQAASKYYSALRTANLTRGRINNALLLTLSGCYSHHWQAAIVCYATAVETLLTYSRRPGLTERLSTAYACVVETEPDLRDIAFQEFHALYSIRSDIIHGRIHSIPEADRLPSLVRFSEMVRRLWRIVSSSPQVTAALESTDEQRETYFDKIRSEYVAPPRR